MTPTPTPNSLSMPPPKSHVIIGSRGSALALWQANHVKTLLAEKGVSSDITVIKTTGDRVQDRFLNEIGGKGLFIREIEQALVEGSIDLAIHSLKDMPAVLGAEFTLAAVLPRHAATDLYIAHPQRPLTGVATGAVLAKEFFHNNSELTIATGSLRRQSLLKSVNPNIKTIGIRGNVDTRLKKLGESDWSGLILAKASLDRLQIQGFQCHELDSQWFVPSPAQGALAIETLKSHPIAAWLDIFDCKKTHSAVSAERELLRLLGGDCTMPFACHVAESTSNGSRAITARAMILDNHGHYCQIEEQTAATYEPLQLARQLYDKLMAKGAATILKNLGIKVQ